MWSFRKIVGSPNSSIDWILWVQSPWHQPPVHLSHDQAQAVDLAAEACGIGPSNRQAGLNDVETKKKTELMMSF